MKSITVAELIKKLKELPEDLEVYQYCPECDMHIEITDTTESIGNVIGRGNKREKHVCLVNQ